MSEIAQPVSRNNENSSYPKGAKYAAIGGVAGALAATACCILPLVLFSLGVTGAWIGQLTALSAYQPFFISLAFGSLGYGYWLVYAKERYKCTDGEACTRPLPNRIVKASLWGATFLVLLVITWPYLLPWIL